MPTYKADKPTKDGRQYYFIVSYTDTKGNHQQYKSKNFRTQKECREEEAKYLLTANMSVSSEITFSQLSDIYLEEQKSLVKPQTVPHLQDVLRWINASLGSIKVAKMTRMQYEAFRNSLDGLSASYKNKINRQLKCLLKFALNRYDIYNSIPDKYPSFREDKIAQSIDFYDLEEFNKFIATTDDPRFIGLFTTLFFCGLRFGEANALQFKDIYNNQLHITKTVNTKMKGDKAKYLTTSPKTPSSVRILPIPKRVANCLKTLLEKWQQEKDFSEDYYVFGGYFPLPETTVTKQKNKMCEEAGLRQIRIHDFRHSCASLLINNGASATLVAQYLGHSNTQMTLNTYSHLWKSKLDEITEAIDNFR